MITPCDTTMSATSDPSSQSDPSSTISAPDAATSVQHAATSSESIPEAAIAPVPFSLSALSVTSCSLHQPVPDVRTYLATRKPADHFTVEESLFVTLPLAIRSELRALLGIRPGGGAFGTVKSLVKARLSTQSACAQVVRSYRDWHWNVKTFRARYDLWSKAKDWVALVNRAKAGIEWQCRADDGLPDEFIQFVATRFGEFTRADGKRQAIMSIKRQWKTGRNDAGNEEMIPGYEKHWADRNPEILPAGWHYSNILRQIKAAAVFTKAHQALLHQGQAAAVAHLPQALGTRDNLLFLSEVQFDDVKTDWRILDTETGQICDLWLLVARDRATAMLLGFGMRPARARDDGTQEHLKLRDMKQLCGWILERFGLPPYLVIWKIERGTATLSEGSAAALAENLPGRIRVSFSSMLGGNSASAGYFERRIGNSKGKASLESHNRLMHTIGANLPAQTGPAYGVRPADLVSREKEAVTIWTLAQQLPVHLRGQAQYPVLTIPQARKELLRIFQIQNERTDHALEGFEDVVEAYDETRGLWLPQSSFPSLPSVGVKIRKRKESPIERCTRLVAPYADQWTRVSPEIITAFYAHTQRKVTVEDNGEIQFTHDGKPLTFRRPESIGPSSPLSSMPPIPSGTKLLGYFNPDEPCYLHLTDGRGAIIGTWLLRSRAGDQAAVSAAIEYSKHALKVAREHSENLAAPNHAKLDQMRADNDELIAANTFIEVAATHHAPRTTVTSPVAAALTSIPRTRAAAADAAKERAAAAEAARETLMNAML